MTRLVSALRHWWLVVLGLIVVVGSWWAYENIPGVHFQVMVAWAKAYDTFVPPQDVLPTPVEVLASPTLAPRASATPQPTATPNPAATATAVLPTPTPLPESVLLTGVRHEQQYFNNCGPTTLAMALSFWDWEGDQHTVRPHLRPNKNDKNVSPEEMSAYLPTIGFDSVVRVNGDIETLERFLAAGYPVIVEKGLVCEEEADRCEGWVGHYTLVMGYNSARQRLFMEDSFLGGDVQLTYAQMLTDWRAFNYTYLVLFPQSDERRAQVLSLLGSAVEVERNYRQALERAQTEAANSKWSPAAFAWFNVGTNLTALGDYAGAAAAYDEARQTGLHTNMLWYQFGPYQAYAEVGRYEDVEHLASFAISTAHLSGVEEAYYWRGRAREVLGLPDKALADYRSALEYNSNFQVAQEALDALTKSQNP